MRIKRLNNKSLIIEVFDSNAVKQWLSVLRDEKTDLEQFKKNADNIACALGIHLADKLPVITRQIITPVGKTKGEYVDSAKILLVAILRSGYPMCKAIHEAIPGAQLALIDIKRDETTAQPHLGYEGLPQNLEQFEQVIIPDPMLATGGSALMVIKMLKQRKVKNIHLISIVSAPEGLKRVKKMHPEVEITVCAIDKGLNSAKYIVPGLGDFGDRYFGNGTLLITDSDGTDLSYHNGKLIR